MPPLLALALLAAGPAPRLADAARAVPDAVLDLRYATSRNLAGRPLYPVARCLLLPAVADRLARAAALLRPRGLRLLLWDCYRPLSVQRALWALRPDPRWVADPAQGSAHNRAAAVDLALADAAGAPVEVPTDHDAFGPRARPGAEAGVPPRAREHARLLAEAMRAAGFLPDRGEWWHFHAPEARGAPLLDLPLEAAAAEAR